MRLTQPRTGYALVLVMLFIALFFSLWAIAYRQTASALRIEAVQAGRITRDEGSAQALAHALALLETGLPPANLYVCCDTLSTPTGVRSFTVTFALEGTNQWSVNVEPSQPGANLLPMPSTFAPG